MTEQIYLVTSGEYSDFGIVGLVRGPAGMGDTIKQRHAAYVKALDVRRNAYFKNPKAPASEYPQGDGAMGWIGSEFTVVDYEEAYLDD